MHPDLRHAGELPPLGAPHHLKAHEWAAFREGVVLGADKQPEGVGGSLVEIGLEQVRHVRSPATAHSVALIKKGACAGRGLAYTDKRA